MDKKIKHLEMIQVIITRMANNSFLLKGWGVILTSALFALVAKDANKLFIFLTILPVIAFWILDGYYLRQERLFRKLYDQVRGKDESEIDFSMDISSVNNQVKGWFLVCLSRAISFFYGTILLLVVILALVFIIDC
jgi:hypothetical protein